jgi:hypothetical protein
MADSSAVSASLSAGPTEGGVRRNSTGNGATEASSPATTGTDKKQQHNMTVRIERPIRIRKEFEPAHRRASLAMSIEESEQTSFHISQIHRLLLFMQSPELQTPLRLQTQFPPLHPVVGRGVVQS